MRGRLEDGSGDALPGPPGSAQGDTRAGWGGGRDAGSQPLAAAQTVWSRCVSHASRETEAEAKDGAVPSGSGENPGTAINGPIAGGHAEQAKKHRARNAGEPALRGDYCLCTPNSFVHRVTGRSAPRRSAHPRAFRESAEWKWDYRRTRRLPKNPGRAALAILRAAL